MGGGGAIMPAIFLQLFFTKIGRAALIGAVVVVAGAWAWGSIYNSGKDAVLEDVREQNRGATNAANKIEFDLDQCFDAGRLWDFAAGKCARDRVGPW